MTMNTITHEPGVQSLHDHVVNLVAQRWAKSLHCRITINTGSEKNRWAGSDRSYPDIVGWKPSLGRHTLELIAEVATEESIAGAEVYRRWQDYAALGVPFYLFVPKGYRAKAQQLAAKAGVALNGIYEYAFVNGMFQLL